jgi:hypothetical protein
MRLDLMKELFLFLRHRRRQNILLSLQDLWFLLPD